MKLIYTHESTYGHPVGNVVKAITKGMEFDADKLEAERLLKLGYAEKVSKKTDSKKENKGDNQPKYSKTTKKDDLIAIAGKLGLEIEEDTKNADIVDVLDKYYGFISEGKTEDEAKELINEAKDINPEDDKVAPPNVSPADVVTNG